MRSTIILLLLAFAAPIRAQFELPCAPNTLPEWMQTVAWDKKPEPYVRSKSEPLHTNTFIGTWSVQKKHGRRFDFWSDKHRVVIQEVDEQRSLKRYHFLDLQANVRMNAHVDKGQALFIVEDLYLKDVGYFREIWSTSVEPTGRTETILGANCEELLGIDGNKDTTYYWRTDKYPKLFADMKVWSPWLCREGELEFLTTLCDTPAGGCMRAEWPKRKYDPPAGSIAMLSITPGTSPMPTIEAKERFVAERRFLWNNSSGIGTLPTWMRAYVSDLKPDSLPAAYTPKPVTRDIPDNTFIGTLTAETPTMILGMHDPKTGRDTTHRLARYSYWADARRAVLIMDDPDDEGYLFVAVDLDADVMMASHNEMSGHVIPKLYIRSLEDVGLKEFGNGLELDFTPRGKFQNMLGRECELHTTSEHFLSHFWFPKKATLNPVFDMKNWMVQRMGQKMQDLMFFGVADKPMPMAVMGTTLTSYKQGKFPPPLADLRYYRVKDERLEQPRRRQEPPEVEVREVTVEEMLSDGGDVAVPDMVMAEPMQEAPQVATEGRGTDVVGEAPNPSRGSGSGVGADGSRVLNLHPAIDSLMKATTNTFIGTATLRFTSTRGDKTTSWTVRYASTTDKMVLIGQDEQPGITEHTRAYVLDRNARTEDLYIPVETGFRTYNGPLVAHSAPISPPAVTDSIIGGSRKLIGRDTEHRLLEGTDDRRESMVDTKTPSLFHDVFGARRSWSGIEILLRGPMITSTRPGLPLFASYQYKTEETLFMSVLELKPGPVDPKLFEITRKSWDLK